MISKLFKWAAAITCALPLVAGATTENWFSCDAGDSPASPSGAAWQVGEEAATPQVEDDNIVIDYDADATLDLVPSVDSPDTNTLVRVTLSAAFAPNEESGLTAPDDAQTALAVAYDANDVTNYYAYTADGWVALTGATPANEDTLVNAVIALDYSLVGASTPVVKACFKIGDTVLSYEDGENEPVQWLTLPAPAVTAGNVNKISFAGTGLLASVGAGVDLGVAEVEDIKYTTFAAALAAAEEASDKTITVLRTTDGTDTIGSGALADYKVENGTLVAKTYTVMVVSNDETVTNKFETLSEAAEEATSGTSILLLANSEADLSLPTGVSFLVNGFTYSGEVTAAAGNGYEVVQNEGVYTIVDNTASTWTGSTDNNWTTGSNWSTGCAPTEYTAVTIPSEDVPEGGWLIYVGGDAKSKSIALLGDTTIQRDASISFNGCIVVQEGITTGVTPATLTLNKSFVFAGASEVSISCPIVCANTSGFTSNSTGTFNISGAISGTGTLEFRKAVTLSQDLTVASDGLSAKFEAQPTFSNGAVLKGDGTVVWTVEPGSEVQTMLRDSANWTGICELVNVAKNSLRFQDYGNLESTVRLNGVTGYMAFPSSATPQNDATVKVLDIAAGGLTLGDAFHSKTVVFDATKITGSGPIAVGTRSSTASASTVTKYVFTGDMSGFSGTLSFGSLTSYRPAIIIATSSSNLPTPSDYGQIIVAEGATAYVNNTWTAPGAMVVIGDVVMGATGSIAGDNGIAGAGTISYSALPAATTSLAFRETTLITSGIGTIPVWSGSVILPATTIAAKTGIPLIGLSSSNGTIVVKGITRATAANSIHLNTGTATIKGKVQLDGDLYITDGNSNATYTWNEITGEGNLFVTAAGGSASGIRHAITKLSDYTGEITAESSVSLTIGTVAVPSFTLGQKMVDLAANCNLTTSPGAITVEVNGSSLDGHHLFKATDGDLYVIAAQVTVDETTTYFATLEAAAEFALANDAQIAKVDPATPTELPGWSYENGWFTKLDIAQVGETTYKTLKSAIETGTTEDIVLINNCAETVTLGVGQTIKPGAYAFSGVLKGAGTIYYAAKPTTVPTFEDWTGTFVADWDGAHGTSFPANDYGILGSVIEVRKLGGGYVPLPGSENVDRTVLPTISIPEGCYMKLANGYSGFKTVFTKVTGAGAMTNNTYTVEIATLENFTGTISSDVGTKIDDIVTSETLVAGACLVKGGMFSDVASITVNGSAPSIALEAKTGEEPGIYCVVKATITKGSEVTPCATVSEALMTVMYTFAPADKPGTVVTVLDAEWEHTAEYAEYLDPYWTWNAEARTYTYKTFVARILTTEYTSLAEAVEAAQAGDTITLIADDRVSFAGGGQILVDKALTIDGAGYTVYGKSAWTAAEINNVRDNKGADPTLVHGIKVVGSGNVTIKNVAFTEFADATYCNGGCAYAVFTPDTYTGMLTLDNVQIDKFNRTAIDIRGGTFEITNCVVTCNATGMGSSFLVFQQPVQFLGAATGRVVDSTVTGFCANFPAGTAEEELYDAGGIVSWSSAAVAIVDCTVTTDNAHSFGIESDGTGVVTISGTTVEAASSVGYWGDGTSVVITSGDYTGELYGYGNGSLAVSGGTFDRQVPAEFCADGKVPTTTPDASGKYTVVDYVPPSGIDPTSDEGAPIAVDTSKTPEQQAADAQAAAAAMDVQKTADAASVDQTTWNGYFTKTAEKVNDVWVAKAELNPAVVLPVDGAEETPLTDMLESVAAAAVDTTGKTAAEVPTKAGLYYWISGATEVNAASYTPGTAVLGDGTNKEIARPTLTGENGKAFFKVCVDVVAPTKE